jgi:hypothetical protein
MQCCVEISALPSYRPPNQTVKRGRCEAERLRPTVRGQASGVYYLMVLSPTPLLVLVYEWHLGLLAVDSDRTPNPHL